MRTFLLGVGTSLLGVFLTGVSLVGVFLMGDTLCERLCWYWSINVAIELPSCVFLFFGVLHFLSTRVGGGGGGVSGFGGTGGSLGNVDISEEHDDSASSKIFL